MQSDTGHLRARARRIATAVSLLWVGLVVAYAVGYLGTRPPGGLMLVLVGLGLIAAAALPVALVWAIAFLYRGHLSQREGEGALIDRIAALERKLEALASAQKAVARATRPGARPEPPASQAPPAPAPQEPVVQEPDLQEPIVQEPVAATGGGEAEDPQPFLPLEDTGPQPLTLAETIKALNFPQDAQDNAGFAVLARALASHELAKLLQASEDCLNILAQRGLYMDDLLPAPASADDWRQFAKGGKARAALLPLTGITDPAALDLVQELMRGDPIFRDAALHFQRQFDALLHRAAPEAGDDALLQLVDTRSGRAFILLVQVNGMLSQTRD